MRLSTLRALTLRLLLAALVVAVAVGLRAAGPETADTTGWRAGVLVDRLETVGIVLVAVLLLPSLALAVWARGEGAPLRRRARPRTWVVLVAFALTLAAALLLANRANRPPRPPAEVVTDEPTPPPTTGAPQDNRGGPPWLLVSGLVVVAVGAAVLTARRRRTEVEVLEQAQEPVAETPWHAGVRAATEALRSRPQDPPRARVLAAYEAFERALATQGLVRGTAGTATGLLDRAIAEGFPAADALRLTELFSAARYGEAPVTEQDVAAAEQALTSVLAAT